MKIVQKENQGGFSPESVEIRQPLARDYVKATQMSKARDKDVNQIGYLVCLLSLVCTFDGEKLPPEDVERLSGSDFMELASQVEPENPIVGTPLPEASSSSQEPPAGASEK